MEALIGFILFAACVYLIVVGWKVFLWILGICLALTIISALCQSVEERGENAK